MIASSPGAVRYMAPELLNPSQFDLANSNPSKESDVYSLAMTAYEVRLSHSAYGHHWHHRLAVRYSRGSYRTETIGVVSSPSKLWPAIGQPVQQTPDGCGTKYGT